MKLLYGAIVLACVPLVIAGNDTAYPTEKLASFVLEKVDVTTLPSAIRPKRAKGKKTFGDYGYVARELGEKKALLDPPQGGLADFDRSTGSTEVWHLRLHEQPVKK